MRIDSNYYTSLYTETAQMIRRTAPALILPFVLLFIPTIAAILMSFGVLIIISGYLGVMLEAYVYNRELARQKYLAALDCAEAKSRCRVSSELPDDERENYAEVISKIANNTYLAENYADDNLYVDYHSIPEDNNEVSVEIKLLKDGNLHASYPSGLKSFVTSKEFKLSRIFSLAIVRRVMITLGFICLIVPGVIMSINYALSSFVMLNYPEIKSPFEVLKKTKDIIKGHRKDFLKLTTTFAMPILTSILSLGILLPWTLPFIKMLKARFYFDLTHPDGIEPPPYFS